MIYVFISLYSVEIESQFQTEKEEVCLDYEDRLQDVQVSLVKIKRFQ